MNGLLILRLHTLKSHVPQSAVRIDRSILDGSFRDIAVTVAIPYGRLRVTTDSTDNPTDGYMIHPSCLFTQRLAPSIKLTAVGPSF